MPQKDDKFSKRVSEREKRRLDTERQDKKIWFGLGMFGMVGWSITVPAVAAAFLGIWIDANFSGRYSWTLMLFMAGLCLGCYNAWYWMQKERREITGEDKGKKK
jgi:ATP synthase protein I